MPTKAKPTYPFAVCCGRGWYDIKPWLAHLRSVHGTDHEACPGCGGDSDHLPGCPTGGRE